MLHFVWLAWVGSSIGVYYDVIERIDQGVAKIHQRSCRRRFRMWASWEWPVVAASTPPRVTMIQAKTRRITLPYEEVPRQHNEENKCTPKHNEHPSLMRSSSKLHSMINRHHSNNRDNGWIPMIHSRVSNSLTVWMILNWIPITMLLQLWRIQLSHNHQQHPHKAMRIKLPSTPNVDRIQFMQRRLVNHTIG